MPGLLTLHANDWVAVPDASLRNALAELLAKIPASILSAIAAKNTADSTGATATDSAKLVQPNGTTAGLPTIDPTKNWLMPMAFPEGSPTHPAYGAGHATVAGVHYYTDYFASLRMGERLTVSILEEQAALYGEHMSMSFTSFDGDRIRVSGQGGRSRVSVVDRDRHTVKASDWYHRYA